jgi:mannosyltransferase
LRILAAMPGQLSAGQRRETSAAALRSSSAAQVVAVLTVCAAALRFGTLDVQSIWFDESATMVLVRRGLAGMLAHLAKSESAPPLYYILVWTWTKIFGAGPIGFRSFSALAGTLTVPVMYLVGKRVSPRVGVWAAALTAFSPAMYYYSQEARCYALLILLSAIAFLLWQRALEQPGARRLWLWAGVSALAVLTHYFAAFLFIPEALFLVWRLGWRRVTAPVAAVLAVGAALAPLANAEVGNGAKISWIEEASLGSRVGQAAKEFLVGPYGPSGKLEILAAAIAALLTVGAAMLVLRRAKSSERRIARDAAIVAIIALAIPLLPAAAHVLDLFDGRNVIAVWIPFAAIVAVGLGCACAGAAGWILGTSLCALWLALILAINVLPGYQRDDWRGAAQALPFAQVSRIVVAGPNAFDPLSIYLPDLHRVSGPTALVREVDFISLRVRHTAGAASAPTVQTNAPAGFRLAGVRDSEAFAVARFIAPHASTVSAEALHALSGNPAAEAIVER